MCTLERMELVFKLTQRPGRIMCLWTFKSSLSSTECEHDGIPLVYQGVKVDTRVTI